MRVTFLFALPQYIDSTASFRIACGVKVGIQLAFVMVRRAGMRTHGGPQRFETLAIGPSGLA